MPFYPTEAEVWEALKVYIKVKITVYFSADGGTSKLSKLQPQLRPVVSVKERRLLVLQLSSN